MDLVTKRELQLVEKLRFSLEDLQLPTEFLEERFLVRFIRARDHKLVEAEAMFRNFIKWREEFRIVKILEWKFPLKFRRFWPFDITGFDRRGSPIMILPFGIWDPRKVGKDYNAYIKYTHWQFENMWKLIKARSEGRPTYHQAIMIFDFEHLALPAITTLDAITGFLNGVKTSDSCYPEMLRIGIFINTPYIFNMGWRLVKPLLSASTHSKINILGYDMKACTNLLLEYADKDQFPEKYGGTFPNDCGLYIDHGKVGSKYFRNQLL